MKDQPFADMDEATRKRYLGYIEAGKRFKALKEKEAMNAKNEEQAHAKLSASGSHRWINCPGSIEAEEGYEDTTSDHAKEGSVAHFLAEMALVHEKPAEFWKGQKVFVYKDNGDIKALMTASHKVTAEEEALYDVFEINDEMCGYVQEYVDYVRSHIDENSDATFEMRVDFSPWTAPGQFGTADAIIINGEKVVVVDLKYGKGNKVFVEENSQARLYALGVIEDLGMVYDLKEIKLVIHQPRLDHVDEEEMTVEDLLKWGKSIKTKAKAALKPGAKRVAGELQCKWCKAKADCPELAKLALETAAKEFEESVFKIKDVDTLDIETKVEIYKRRDLIAGFLDAVSISLHEEIKHGGEVPGFKLVEGRSNRVWKNEEEVEKLLNKLEELKPDDIYTKKLNGPAPIEKILGKEHEIIVEHVTKPEGKPTLVPEADKREALIFNPAEEFDGVEE